MRPRLSRKHDDLTRSKIKTTQLLHRLQNFALGGLDPKTKRPIEMSPQQVRAATVVLGKVLPDLSASTIDGNLELGDGLLGAIEAARKRVARP